jgi:hypothetical protein
LQSGALVGGFDVPDAFRDGVRLRLCLLQCHPSPQPGYGPQEEADARCTWRQPERRPQVWPALDALIRPEQQFDAALQDPYQDRPVLYHGMAQCSGIAAKPALEVFLTGDGVSRQPLIGRRQRAIGVGGLRLSIAVDEVAAEHDARSEEPEDIWSHLRQHSIVRDAIVIYEIGSHRAHGCYILEGRARIIAQVEVVRAGPEMVGDVPRLQVGAGIDET